MGRKIEWIEKDSVGKNRNRVLKHIFDDRYYNTVYMSWKLRRSLANDFAPICICNQNINCQHQRIKKGVFFGFRGVWSETLEQLDDALVPVVVEVDEFGELQASVLEFVWFWSCIWCCSPDLAADMAAAAAAIDWCWSKYEAGIDIIFWH